MSYIYLLLLLGFIFGILGAIMAGLITYNEYVHHYPTKGEPIRIALRIGIFAFIFFIIMYIVLALCVFRDNSIIIIMTWVLYAVLSALFASLLAIFGKIGIKNIDSNLAVAIRTVIIVFFAWGIVLIRGNAGDIFISDPRRENHYGECDWCDFSNSRCLGHNLYKVIPIM